MIEVKDTTHQVIITRPNSTRDTLRIGRIEHWFGQTIVDLYDGDAVRMAKVTRDSVFFYKAHFEFKTARTVKTQPAAYSKTRK